LQSKLFTQTKSFPNGKGVVLYNYIPPFMTGSETDMPLGVHKKSKRHTVLWVS